MLSGKLAKIGLAAFGLAFLTGCHTDMWQQPKIHLAQEESDFFPDGQAARPLVQGTVVHRPDGTIRTGNPFYTGLSNGRLVEGFPPEALRAFNNDTRLMLLRGQERFEIFCSPCHGLTGNGQGMIAQRGLGQRRMPANYHTPRLRAMPNGHFYDVITNGFGVMYSYASRVQQPQDRWAIVAYIRALQLSQNARPAEVPGGDPVKAQAARKEKGEGAPVERRWMGDPALIRGSQAGPAGQGGGQE
jgi:mono/diheme cytochrome c family protein